MEQILDFISSDGLVMIPVLIILGIFIKETNYIKNELIPFILLGISLILTPLLMTGFNANNIVQAILVTGAAVLGNQIYKQITYLKDGDKGDKED